MKQPPHLLVFGASGAIGQTICETALQRGWQVTGVARSVPEKTLNGYDEVKYLAVNPLSKDFNVEVLRSSTPYTSICWAQGANLNDNVYTVDLERHLEIYNANVVYILATLKALLDNKLVAPATRMCVISSIWQNLAKQSKLSYGISKAALQGLVLSAAADLAVDGHLINAVLPGVLDTPMARKNLSAAQIDSLTAATAFGRLASLNDVANLVCFLCSPENTGITGQFITADLGFSHVGLSKPATFKITASTGSYEVIVAQGNFAETISQIEDAHILADEFFRPAFQNSPAKPVFIEASEPAKSLDRIAPIIEQLRAAGANRSTHLVAIGGGIIQDISAFIASVYMRGLAWSYDPTTVLAMVDSCIGGKSSINVGPYKNLVGTFHPPKLILVDPALAETLPRDQFASGLIEAAKICFCRGPEAFSNYLATSPSAAMFTSALEQVILESLNAKKHFIEIDEFDKKERLLLNFGHTFGHAIEGASHYAVPHGIAVGLGILCALNFQRQRGIAYSSAPRVAQLEQHLLYMVHALPNLAGHLHSLPLDEVLERIASDKKHTTTHYILILVNPTGEVILERVPRTPATDVQLTQAIQTMIATIESSKS